jgi:DNA-binding IclR family transcriptional regulator
MWDLPWCSTLLRLLEAFDGYHASRLAVRAIAVVEAPVMNGIRVSMVIGSRRPGYIGATGKVILSRVADHQGACDSGQRRAAAVDAAHRPEDAGRSRSSIGATHFGPVGW